MPRSREERFIIAKREEIWLCLVESELCTVKTIANLTGYSTKEIYRRIKRARNRRRQYQEREERQDPWLLPRFPRNATIPFRKATCGDIHNKQDPIVPGSREVCVLCGLSGLDHLFTGLSKEANKDYHPRASKRGYNLPAKPAKGLKGGKR